MRKAIGDGSVIDVGMDVDPRDQEIESLRAENRRLQRAVSDAQVDAQRAREDADRALSALRRQLSPLYRALQAVFGELDAAGVADAPAAQTAAAGPSAAGAPDPRVAAVWDAWKSKMGTAAKIIGALQVHGELNTQQLAVVVGLHRTTIPALILKLNKAGLINKNGGRFSLKAL